ncbi:MAG: DUF1015 domain-containing protein [Armatimonadota bacterium]
MAKITAFRGMRPAANTSVDSFVAPPYDVISPAQREAYRAKGTSFTELTLPDSYPIAAETLKRWIADGVLKQDDQPSYYLYEQLFDVSGKQYRRLGLFCLLQLAEYAEGVVFPHENTQSGAKADRLELQKATKANLEPIYLLGEDAQGELQSLLESWADQLTPIAATQQPDGWHKLSIINDPEKVALVTKVVGPQRLWIADGHHRYETALNYRREVGGASTENMMLVISSFKDPGLVIMPTHRLIEAVPAGSYEMMLTELAGNFNVAACTADDAWAKLNAIEGNRCFAYVGKDGRAFTADLKAEADLTAIMPEGTPVDFHKLDTALLQFCALQPLLGISEEQLRQKKGIHYTPEASEALDSLKNGEAEGVFLLKGISVEQMRLVALAGCKMPPKSTYFYPKLISGIVFRQI